MENWEETTHLTNNGDDKTNYLLSSHNKIYIIQRKISIKSVILRLMRVSNGKYPFSIQVWFEIDDGTIRDNINGKMFNWLGTKI